MFRIAVPLLALALLMPLALAHTVERTEVANGALWFRQHVEANPDGQAGVHVTLEAGSDQADVSQGAHGNCNVVGEPSPDDLSVYCPYAELTGIVESYPVLLCSVQPAGRTGCGFQDDPNFPTSGASVFLHQAVARPELCVSILTSETGRVLPCVFFEQTPTGAGVRSCLAVTGVAPLGERFDVICDSNIPQVFPLP